MVTLYMDVFFFLTSHYLAIFTSPKEKSIVGSRWSVVIQTYFHWHLNFDMILTVSLYHQSQRNLSLKLWALLEPNVHCSGAEKSWLFRSGLHNLWDFSISLHLPGQKEHFSNYILPGALLEQNNHLQSKK